MSDRWLFVVDTDGHAGNYERMLAAYMTGKWDQETHGGDQAAVAEKELDDEAKKYFDSHCLMCHEEVDDFHADVYQIIYPTPGWWNNGKGDIKKGKPTKEELGQCYQKQVWPAYQSVALFFDEQPPEKIITVLKERAAKFSKEGKIFDQPVVLKVTGFRLIHEKTEVRVSETNL